MPSGRLHRPKLAFRAALVAANAHYAHRGRAAPWRCAHRARARGGRWRFLAALACVLGLVLATPAAAQTSAPLPPQRVQYEYDVLMAQYRANPRDPAVLNALGILYAQAGQMGDAVRLWQHGVQISPHYVHFYNNLGSALKSLGRVDEARQVYRQGLAHENSFWIHYNLAILEWETGRRESALAAIDTCLALNPSYAPALAKAQEWRTTTQYRVENNVFAPKPPMSLDVPSLPPSYEMTAPAPATPIDETPETPLTVADVTARLRALPNRPWGRVVALTFDDGPHGSLTPRLLDLLAAEGVRATFFAVGEQAQRHADIVARIAASGHELGNHSMTHPSLSGVSTGRVRAEIVGASGLLARLSGRPVKVFRPPYGRCDRRVDAVLAEEGLTKVMWDADSRDWQGLSVNSILRRVLRSFSPGAIVLFHDVHPNGINALPLFITALKAAGYRFVTVSELLALRSTAS